MYRVRNFEEERTRTLYLRLGHRIRGTKEIEELFEGNPKVKLPRQASRACHVVFDNVEEKLKGLKNLKGKIVDGKRVIAYSPKTKPKENKISQKKIVVPKPRKEKKITQTLFVSNLKDKTTADDLKKAFPGCRTVAMLNSNSKGLRSAFVKMESIEVAEGYLKKLKECPEVNGNKVSVHADTRVSKGRRGAELRKLKKQKNEEKREENVDEEEEDDDDGDGDDKSSEENDSETE